MKRLVALIAPFGILLSAMAASAWPWSAQPVAASLPRPITSAIVSDAIPNEHAVPGVIGAHITVKLAFQALGRLSQRHVNIGDRVRRDDLLASMDPKDLQDDVRAAKARAIAATVEFRTAQATAERTHALARRNVATTAQLEQTQQALAAATAAHQQAQSELVLAQDAEKYSELRAPFDGIVSDVMATPGTVVNAGDTIVQLAAQDDLEAVIDLNPAILAQLNLGDRFEIWSERDPGTLFQARISLIEPVTDAATRTRRVHLSLDDNAALRLGALIRARPMLHDRERVTIPASAMLMRKGQPYVWTVNQGDSGRFVRLQRIEIADTKIGDTISVILGLAPGDEVVVRGINSLTEGQPVGESVSP